MYSDLFYILFVTSTNLVSPHFFHKFFSVSAVEKENKLFIGLKQFFFRFGPITTLFSFSTPQGEKNSWKKLRKARLVVWCHEQDIRQVEERKKWKFTFFIQNLQTKWNFGTLEFPLSTYYCLELLISNQFLFMWHLTFLQASCENNNYFPFSIKQLFFNLQWRSNVRFGDLTTASKQEELNAEKQNSTRKYRLILIRATYTFRPLSHKITNDCTQILYLLFCTYRLIYLWGRTKILLSSYLSHDLVWDSHILYLLRACNCSENKMQQFQVCNIYKTWETKNNLMPY